MFQTYGFRQGGISAVGIGIVGFVLAPVAGQASAIGPIPRASAATPQESKKPRLVVTASVYPPPNANGWNRNYLGSALDPDTGVVVTFHCSGGVPPIQCPSAQAVAAEGAKQKITGKASDSVGQRAAAIATVSVDNTPPVIEVSISPPPNAKNWNNTDVVVRFKCRDSLSGVASCPTSRKLKSEGPYQVIAGSATDRAGNTAFFNTAIYIEKTGPTVQAKLKPPANAQGWNHDDVVVTFDCSRPISGSFRCLRAEAMSQEGIQRKITRSVTDNAGNTATTTVSINLDKTPPALRVTSPPCGMTVFTPNVSVRGTVNDNLSGVAAVACNGKPALVARGSFACDVGLSPGKNIIKVVANDVAGNSSKETTWVNYVSK